MVRPEYLPMSNLGLAGSLVVVAILVAGCVGESGSPEPPRPALTFEGFKVETTPFEPFEQAGENHIAYAGDLFGIYASNEDGMARYTIVSEDTVYISNFLMGWTAYPRDEAPGGRAWRLDTWDVRGLIENGQYDGTGYVGDIEVRGTVSQYTVTTEPWQIVGEFEPELPYTLTPETNELPFQLSIPNGAMTESQLAAAADVVRGNHATILGWLNDYVTANNGNVPQNVDADTLFVQRLGASWPQNPFDRAGVQNLEESGHFGWFRCNARDAVYLGYGWDGSVLGTSYGAGCSP